MHVSFTNLAWVAAVAFAAPLLLGLAPRVRVPAAVLEIVAGIAIGPSGLRWVRVDVPVEVVSTLGLAFLPFGFLVPVFFVASGLRFDLRALTASPAAIARVPAFLAALVLVRGLPALVYRLAVGPRRAAAAGLLQATSLSLLVAAAEIGMRLGLIGRATGAAMVAAGLLSVVLFPAAALTLLRGARRRGTSGPIRLSART